LGKPRKILLAFPLPEQAKNSLAIKLSLLQVSVPEKMFAKEGKELLLRGPGIG